MFSIGLRYCGGCNPQIDRSKIVRQVKEGLENPGMEVCLCTDKHEAIDTILLVSGCRHACAEQGYFNADPKIQLISAKGDMVDDTYLREEDIAAYLIKKMKRRDAELFASQRGVFLGLEEDVYPVK